MMNEQTTNEPLKTEKSLPRIAFLLRLWCVDESGRANWRASLEMPETGKRIGFANLEQLFMYLIDLSEHQGGVPDNETARME